jgi:hypothetical protein
MFIIPNTNCLLSIKLFTSSANDDIVVKEPQKPIAKKKAYFGSRFHETAKTENIPKIKLPIILTIKTFNGSPLMTSGDSTILYLKKAPHTAPTPRSKYSKPFIVKSLLINEIMNVIKVIKWIKIKWIKLSSKLNL